MNINIDFKTEEDAILLYNNYKVKIDKNIIECLNMGDEIIDEVTIRFPTIEYKNNYAIQGMTFMVKNKLENSFDLILTKLEK